MINSIFFGTLALDSILSSRNKILNYLTDKGFKIVESNKYLKRNLYRTLQEVNFSKVTNAADHSFRLKDQKYMIGTVPQEHGL